ncbi:MAG: type II toxin-antitoxin system RelE family toxin [Solirubrobacteraceae bacterium]
MPRVVLLARRARAELLELSWPVIDAVEEALLVIEREPDSGYPLRGRLRGLHSLRVGSLRIIYKIIEDGNTVRVAAIRHRSSAYGRDRR